MFGLEREGVQDSNIVFTLIDADVKFDGASEKVTTTQKLASGESRKQDIYQKL